MRCRTLSILLSAALLTTPLAAQDGDAEPPLDIQPAEDEGVEDAAPEDAEEGDSTEGTPEEGEAAGDAAGEDAASEDAASEDGVREDAAGEDAAREDAVREDAASDGAESGDAMDAGTAEAPPSGPGQVTYWGALEVEEPPEVEFSDMELAGIILTGIAVATVGAGGVLWSEGFDTVGPALVGSGAGVLAIGGVLFFLGEDSPEEVEPPEDVEVAPELSLGVDGTFSIGLRGRF